MMDPTAMMDMDPAPTKTRSLMARAARNAGWSDLAHRIEAALPVTLEQEHLPIELP
jgi:hypothetical protein